MLTRLFLVLLFLALPVAVADSTRADRILRDLERRLKTWQRKYYRLHQKATKRAIKALKRELAGAMHAEDLDLAIKIRAMIDHLENTVPKIVMVPKKAAAKAPKAATVAKVTITGATATPLRDGVRFFSNRGYGLIEVPAAMQGYHFSRLRAGGRAVVTCTLPRRQIVYLACHQSEPAPAGWQKTAMAIRYSDRSQSRLILYSRAVGPGKITVRQNHFCGPVIIFKE